MNKIFLSAGHQKIGADPGAVSGGKKESDLSDEFMHLLKTECERLGIAVITDAPTNTFYQTLRFFANLVKPVNLAVDIHFNAATAKATGTEVIVPNNHSTNEWFIADNVGKIISRELQIYNRGVKTEADTPRKRLGWMRIACETILLEVCFITNSIDMQKYSDYKTGCAIRLAEYFKMI